MEIKINVEDYLSKEDIKEICEDTMRNLIKEQFRKEADVDRIITNLSYEFLFKQISESIGEDAVALIKSKVYKLLQNDNIVKYELFRKADVWERSEAVGYSILKQAIKDNADLINERVKETISAYDFGNKEEIKYAIEDCVLLKLTHRAKMDWFNIDNQLRCRDLENNNRIISTRKAVKQIVEGLTEYDIRCLTFLEILTLLNLLNRI